MSKYDVYQVLMDYWSEAMQDDVYMIVQDGWGAANVIRKLVPVKDKSGKSTYREEHDFEFGTGKTKDRYKSDLIPPALVVNRYFAEQRDKLEHAQGVLDVATQSWRNLSRKTAARKDFSTT